MSAQKLTEPPMWFGKAKSAQKLTEPPTWFGKAKRAQKLTKPLTWFGSAKKCQKYKPSSIQGLGRPLKPKSRSYAATIPKRMILNSKWGRQPRSPRNYPDGYEGLAIARLGRCLQHACFNHNLVGTDLGTEKASKAELFPGFDLLLEAAPKLDRCPFTFTPVDLRFSLGWFAGWDSNGTDSSTTSSGPGSQLNESMKHLHNQKKQGLKLDIERNAKISHTFSKENLFALLSLALHGRFRDVGLTNSTTLDLYLNSSPVSASVLPSKSSSSMSADKSFKPGESHLFVKPLPKLWQFRELLHHHQH
ncbi:SET-domain containing protein lysinemethyltransferase family protein [Striga asiatica]|uniref:SET-domain containing protein lysinemethyltransferase family protein n=1 Tax=Striga asiatica TaxID=4170 RepID=A0A5A7RFF9_STRAF|nr:SET-domain containing protein lysinemethyltransferase family protein [Striga asiatica]